MWVRYFGPRVNLFAHTQRATEGAYLWPWVRVVYDGDHGTRALVSVGWLGLAGTVGLVVREQDPELERRVRLLTARGYKFGR